MGAYLPKYEQFGTGIYSKLFFLHVRVGSDGGEATTN